MGRLWVARLHISPRTAAKVSGRHGLDVDDLRAHVVGVPGLAYTWDEDPERGLRAIVDLWVGKRRVLVVLYPVPGDDDAYRLGKCVPGLAC